MKVAAFTFALVLAVPLPLRPDVPVPVVWEPDEPAVEVWTVDRPEPLEFDTVEGQVAWAMRRLGRSDAEVACALTIFEGESSLRPDAVGDSGNSFGLGQRHAPAHGRPVLPWPVADQVVWFDGYAHERYGSWCGAADRWLERAAARNGRGHW